MNLKVLELLLLCSFFGLISCKGYFTIIGSNLLRHRSKYHVSITSDGYDKPQTLEIAVRSSKNDGDKRFEALHNVTLINGETQKIALDLKNQPVGEKRYFLEAKNLPGSDEFVKVVKLDLNLKKSAIFVQTDKSIYKPADKVQFRVLVLNADMKPYKSTKVHVYITDGAENRVKQFNDVTMKNGVFQNEIQLSDSPVMGTWKIHVKQGQSAKETTKDFEVAEYTLPKFEVTVDANPDANFKDGKIRATVRAKYTFGKIAKGNATVTAEVENLWWRSKNPRTKVSKSVEVDGKKPVEFDIENELEIKEKDQEKTVKLFATFTEELTGREQNGSATVTIHITPHKIELKKSSNSFKPGLPFSVTAIVQYHDKNAPVSDKFNPIKFTVKYFYDTLRQCEHHPFGRYGFHSEFSDFGPQPRPQQTYECREEHSYEKEHELFLSNGFAKLDLNDIPLNTTKVDVKARYLETEGEANYIKRLESASGQYIQIKSATERPNINEKVRIEVLATENMNRFTYLVVGKGDILVSEFVKVPNQKSFQFEFSPVLGMIPSAHVIVHYITATGEIISDKTKIEFGNELKNFVDVELSKQQAKPGEDLEISVTSKPNSYVGLLGVDQSVLLLKKGNDIEESTVFAELEKYNQADHHNYDWDGWSENRRYRDFDHSYAVIITNAEKEYERKYIPLYSPYQPPPPYWPGGFQNRFGGLGGLGGFGGPMGASASASASSGLIVGGFAMPAMIPQSAVMRFDAPVHHDLALESASPASPMPKPKPVEIRKTFPETWLFDSLEFDSNTSNMNLTKKVPDTITSWIITGFSVDLITGLGLTRRPSKFNVFQPFFVSTNLPYSIKRGEVVSIPILVFNYMEEDQRAEVTLFNSEGEFEFAEVKEENQVRRRKRATEMQRKKNVVVKAQSGSAVSFMIRPLKVGHITIKVVATSAVAGDGVERQLIVEPEGVTQYMNKAVFIDLRNNPEYKANIKVEIPPNAVPDSTKIEASAIGDILGPSIDNLDKLIKLPYGCGEQNMLNFVPNIVVLDYLTTLNKLTPEIEAKSKKYMESGYQRELTYKHDDGSYSAFGKSDKSGSTWLTAFVAKSFRQAAKYISVDEEIIKQALTFLSKVQAPDGSFPEVGHVSHKDMQGGSSKGIALTAYTLITFLENKKHSQGYQETIRKALNYISSNVESLEDNYSLAIASYALQLAKDSLKDSRLAKLDAKSVNENGMKYWKKEVPQSDANNPWCDRPNSVNVEMSSYALQAFIEAGRDPEAVPIMKWLVTQRNSEGGFQSTQDTVVGLQALAKLAARIYVPNSKIDISIKHGRGEPTNLNVNEENALILQKHELPSESRDFEVLARGRGFGILQLSYKYNMNVTGEWPRFKIEPEVHGNSNKDFLHLIACTSFVPDNSAAKSNMAVMEVSLPSGFTFDSDSHPELMKTEKVKKIETKEGDTIVVVYFNDLSAKKICPEIKAYRTHSVAKQKPAPIVVYDYYDNSRRATNFYNPPEISLCDICDGAEECLDDCEEDEINIA